MANEKIQWEEAYKNRNNFVFYPHEEVIRFFSRHITKRIGFGEFEDIARLGRKPRVLDLGCGIGRHVVFSHVMQTEAYGVDLSENAVTIARAWAGREGLSHPDERIVSADITAMPFADNTFDFMVSHGVLDSMSLKNCTNAVKESWRVLQPKALFYCDLISGDDSAHSVDHCGEEVVSGSHENGTIQLYFNESLIHQVFDPWFDIVENTLIRKTSTTTGSFKSRYHVVLQKK
jgi:ubiquinone/menaquinone biosynthesis C-methylase UbiE